MYKLISIIVLSFLSSQCFAAAAVSTVNVPVATDAETHSACIRHKNSDGTYQNGWNGCIAFEATYANTLSKIQATDAAAIKSLDARVLQRLAR